MPDLEGPISETRKTVRFHGPADQDEESLSVEQRSYVDKDRGIVEEEETHLPRCASCGRVIRTQEEAGGLCSRCDRLVDRECAVFCSHPECGALLCRQHAIFIRSYWCKRHGWAVLVKPFAYVVAVLIFVTLAGMCNALT